MNLFHFNPKIICEIDDSVYYFKKRTIKSVRVVRAYRPGYRHPANVIVNDITIEFDNIEQALEFSDLLVSNCKH